MKIQYIGLLPLIIFIILCHVRVYLGIKKRLNDDLTDLAMMICFAFWIFITMFGIGWASTAF